jgi:adenosine deaminase
LHRHLDGSLRPSSLASLAAKDGITLPDDLCFYPNMGLHEALARFAITLSVLQTPARVERVAAEICEDAAEDGVTCLELRFAPQLHQGAAPEAIVEAALRGIDGRGGLILCGLYGEPPEVLESLVAIAASHDGVVGIDLAGGPAAGHDFFMRDYARAYTRARDLGLGRTVHAAEGRDVSEIRTAIEVLHAQRIGHGTSLLDDDAVVELVVEREVTIEACPTSNVHTGVIPDVTAHPLSQWLDRGVRVCVCPDNTLLSDVSSSQEHERVSRIEGIDDAKMARLIDNGHRASFIASS